MRRLPLFVVLLAVTAALGGAPPAGAGGHGSPRPGELTRLSVAPDGAAADHDSGGWVDTSADGRYVVFHSRAANLVPDGVSGWHVYVHDRETGTNERVSVSSDGEPADSFALTPAISDNGRYVSFQSAARNLGDPSGTEQAYVHDRVTGVTRLASVGIDGEPGDGPSYHAEGVSDTGVVTFTSRATNLVPGPQGAPIQVYVSDPETGVERMSEAEDGTPGNGTSTHSRISADGRIVVFVSEATNLVSDDTNSRIDVFVRDRSAGTIELGSVNTEGEQANDTSSRPDISADGRFVTFSSDASNLVPNPLVFSLLFNVYVRDRERGVTEYVSVANSGFRAGGSSIRPRISPDGRYVSFASVARNLGLEERLADWQVYLHDRVTGVTEGVSVNDEHTEADRNTLESAVSGDGRYVAFTSEADNLIPSGQDRVGHIYLRDRGAEAGLVGEPAVSDDGGAVAVSGRPTFTGAVVSGAPGFGDPVAAVRAEAGGAVTAAQVIHRPELDDVQVRVHLAKLPWTPAPTWARLVGSPASVYGLELTTAGIRNEVRASLDEPRLDPDWFLVDPRLGLAVTVPRFGLYRCELACEQVAQLEGGWGTSGYEIRTAVPLPLLGVGEGDELTGLQAFAAAGAEELGPRADVDTLDLPDATLLERRVRVAAVPPGVPAGEADFVPAPVAGGAFTAVLPHPEVERFDVLIEVCRTDDCKVWRSS